MTATHEHPAVYSQSGVLTCPTCFPRHCLMPSVLLPWLPCSPLPVDFTHAYLKCTLSRRCDLHCFCCRIEAKVMSCPWISLVFAINSRSCTILFLPIKHKLYIKEFSGCFYHWSRKLPLSWLLTGLYIVSPQGGSERPAITLSIMTRDSGSMHNGCLLPTLRVTKSV